jgi:K+-sensing histidine kinase KdpD
VSAVRDVDGEGLAWGVAGFAASVLVGVAIEPFRRSIGLENVVIVYLVVVVLAAAVGGRAAGLVAALSAALSYDFFLTTPYHTLRIDSLSQVATVALLFAAGFVASVGARTRRAARRRASIEVHGQVGVIRLVHAVTLAAATGGDVDRAAAEGVMELLGARRVAILRRGPGGEVVVADVGARSGAVDVDDLPRLDADGRLPSGHLRTIEGRLVLPDQGVMLELVRRGVRVGALVVVPGQDQPVTRAIRLGLAAVAHALAASPPLRSYDADAGHRS